MNIEEYISSGILESYVLGEVSAAEKAEVEHMAENHPEIREELNKIELSLENFAFETAVAPPPSVLEEVMASVAPPATDEAPADETPVIPLHTTAPSSGSSWLRYTAAASVFIALGAGFMAFNYWNKWQQAESRLATLIAENQQFAENNKVVNQRLNDIQQAMNIVNNAAYSRIIMNGTDNAPGSLATVYWNANTQDVYLNIQNLKKLPTDKQYQLWAIIDGTPVDAGVFDSDANQFLLSMTKIGNKPAAFAVTIEPKGGSESPTLETMQVVGNV